MNKKIFTIFVFLFTLVVSSCVPINISGSSNLFNTTSNVSDSTLSSSNFICFINYLTCSWNNIFMS